MEKQVYLIKKLEKFLRFTWYNTFYERISLHG